MSSSPRLRVIGLVVGGAVVALAAGFFLLTRGQGSSTAASHTVIPLSKRANQPPPAKTAAKRSARKPAAVRTHASKPAPKPAPKAAPKAAAKAAPKPSQPEVDGVPGSIVAALAHNRVVVVALYAPKIELDEMAMREAEAGARAVGAGFVALNVLNEVQSRPLTQSLGVLEDPGVLVYRRPSEVVVRFAGFADQETIAQAARNAGQ